MHHSWMFGSIFVTCWYSTSILMFYTLAANVQYLSCFVEWLVQQHVSDPFKSSPLVSLESCQSPGMNWHESIFFRSTYHRTRSIDVLSTSGSFTNIHEISFLVPTTLVQKVSYCDHTRSLSTSVAFVAAFWTAHEIQRLMVLGQCHR